MIETEAAIRSNLGRVVQSEHEPLVIGPSRSRLNAYVTENLRQFVAEGSFLIAEGEESVDRILCRIHRIESYPQQLSGPFRSHSEFVTKLELEPVAQIGDSRIDLVLNGNFNGYVLRKATAEELKKWHGIPSGGLYCGELVIDPESHGVPFHIPPDLLYRSLFICGAKGCGKTTCLRGLLPRATSQHETGMTPPCVVILDGEGEFSGEDSQQLFAEAGAEVNLQRISTDITLATVTLAISQIHYEHFVYFAPNLPLNTALHLESICKKLFSMYREKNIVRPGPAFLEDIRNSAWRQPAIHVSQQHAIIRATMSPIFSLFDQDNLPPLLPGELVKSGKVTILDVSTLTDDQQRTVALYLLSVFANYKDKNQDLTGLLLVMDEAQKLFPHRGDLKQEYARRLAKFVGHIVHRGRRRRYGILLSTQYPADVCREVVELCDTKFIFRMSGPQEWLRNTLGTSETARSASELKVGEAYVVSNGLGLHQSVVVRFPLPRAVPVTDVGESNITVRM